jgi:GTP-binding protein Era
MTPSHGTAGEPRHRSGFVAIVGRPNVGKSTLLNQLLGQKVAIVTPKPQTTRARILGIKTLPHAQIVFIDTPGLHPPRTLMNRRMVEVAERALAEADLLLWVVDASAGITAADHELAARLLATSRPMCVVLNKIDCLKRVQLLPLLAALDELAPGRDVIPVSALEKTNFEELLSHIERVLPKGPRYYEPDTWTDQSERMLAQEVVREKVLLQTRDEVPYAVAVTVDRFEDKTTERVSKRSAGRHGWNWNSCSAAASISNSSCACKRNGASARRGSKSSGCRSPGVSSRTSP